MSHGLPINQAPERGSGLRLVIHAGLHKTATTSFQILCAGNRDLLAQSGILYPELRADEFEHNRLAHWLQQSEVATIREELVAKLTAAGNAIDTVLISAEDLEYCLGRPELAAMLERMARDVGFTAIQWHFVLRDRWSYLLSQYAELSKHDSMATMRSMAEQALKFGSVTNVNGQLRRYYEFDYEGRLPAFQARVEGMVFVHEFGDFCAGVVGSPVLHAIGGDDLLNRFVAPERIGAKAERENRRRVWLAVEYRYLCAFFDLDPKRLKALKLALLSPLLLLRHLRARRAEARFKARFLDAFPAFSAQAIEQQCRQVRQ